MNPKPNSITVIGRRWFDRRYGNTYHTSTVLVNGALMYRSPVTYGYDNQYIQTAYDYLQDADIVHPERYSNGMPEHIGTLCDRVGIDLMCEAADVARKSDLTS